MHRILALILVCFVAPDPGDAAAIPPMMVLESDAPPGMQIDPDALTIHLIRPVVRFHPYGAKLINSQAHSGKLLAGVVFLTDSLRPNKDFSYTDIFKERWYTVSGDSDSAAFTMVGEAMAAIMRPDGAPAEETVELGSLAMTEIKLVSLHPIAGDSKIAVTYAFSVQALTPANASPDAVYLTQFFNASSYISR